MFEREEHRYRSIGDRGGAKENFFVFHSLFVFCIVWRSRPSFSIIAIPHLMRCAIVITVDADLHTSTAIARLARFIALRTDGRGLLKFIHQTDRACQNELQTCFDFSTNVIA